MDHRDETSQTLRIKCAACYKKFNQMELLVEHMRTSCHSVHEPMCWICEKHCRSFDSLRQHLIGPLPKADCEKIFKKRGCDICLTFLPSQNALRAHKELCQLSRSNNGLLYRMARLGFQEDLRIDHIRGKVVALSCKIVGGGIDGSLDLCARVCLIDEHERILYDSYVEPNIPITDYRYETSGVRPEYMSDAVPLNQVSRKIQHYLCNGEPLWQIRSTSGMARILVGHNLDHHLNCLQLEYPSVMIRDAAKYPPLMDTNKISNSLKYLSKNYLGYEIQRGVQDPYDDCVATMRLYMRMKSQAHRREDYPLVIDPRHCNIFGSWGQSEFERMTPSQLLEISRSDYYCWCLDSYIN
ncbi:RNA exonuclease 4-like [Solanum dulcamara]|uniref:RNA exonuclease 4-like n=1 Tax=Solanum dulcamara TaxID=45834 RepID=UPI002485BA69|nr:RNA exonuclease 4-like [Solanum dulcamara]